LDWATLMNKPVAYTDVTRLAACFDGHIRIGLCERLRLADRLQDRLSAIINHFYALAAPVGQDAASSPADHKIALLSAGRTRNLVRRAGAVYWASAFANAIRAEDVRLIRGELGEERYAFALANRHLSRPSGKLDLKDGMDAQIEEDGLRCLNAWCQSQPEAIGGRVQLKCPASPAFEIPANSPFNEIGPAIIRCAVA
jgi:hypothetical protein